MNEEKRRIVNRLRNIIQRVSNTDLFTWIVGIGIIILVIVILIFSIVYFVVAILFIALILSWVVGIAWLISLAFIHKTETNKRGFNYHTTMEAIAGFLLGWIDNLFGE